ncbi:4'-phosphopantetheinyl transferase family protein [Mucilaginibacter gilvus]|uniref:4'-phosphopantetheinyl transferase family protein n=1 Tax=Mucilaginibacter gilvus TaxID=2305909 RepID=UPI0014193FCB|nr:4'-phosphopantetheinyl transferase superfamily protein [Mucilaginibacter gilvus]
MISTGNDIVALDLTDIKRTEQGRFYTQILSNSEQKLYQQVSCPQLPFNQYVWLLWSAKESAYKYLKRLTPELVFSPTQIIIQSLKAPNRSGNDVNVTLWESTCDGEFYSGTIVHLSSTLYFRSKTSASWIATVVDQNESFKNIYWGVKSITENSVESQSAEARYFLIDKLRPYFNDLHFKKSLIGYPVIFNNGNELNIPVSIAHHGNYVSYSFVLDQAKLLSDNCEVDWTA